MTSLKYDVSITIKTWKYVYEHSTHKKSVGVHRYTGSVYGYMFTIFQPNHTQFEV